MFGAPVVDALSEALALDRTGGCGMGGLFSVGVFFLLLWNLFLCLSLAFALCVGEGLSGPRSTRSSLEEEKCGLFALVRVGLTRACSDGGGGDGGGGHRGEGGRSGGER